MKASGSVLIATFSVMMVLINLVAGFLFAVGVFTLSSGWEETDGKLLWLAEAGLQKGIWNLMTPVSGGGQGESWTTAGTTETLGDGSYTMVVARWDFALSANGSSATASSSRGANVPSRAIDNNLATFWESGSAPSTSNPQFITVAFPYTLTINKVRFVAPSSSTRPRNYTWQVSSDGTAFTTVVPVTGNSALDVTNTFNVQSNVNYLRLQVTLSGSSGNRVRVSTLEAIGARVTSTGTITVSGTNYTRTVQQTLVADDASPQNQVSYAEPDWVEP